ncbi:MAG: glutamate decarboxylase, partial [Desulfatitalea sp.]|nr:PLP-dependent decarboxylase [Desulfatitalea sp.]NNK00450.1 glutamate decarboxylase [Desulfatitalea sp.]
NTAALEKAIENSIAKGQKPFFVAATAGTTLLGAFDSIQAIAAIGRRYNLWVHVDGAYGGPVILSPKYRHLVRGIETADSFAMDPHKLMNIPLICSVLLVREKGRLRSNLTDLNTEYLYHENDHLNYDLGKISIQCGRRVDVLKLWLAWRFFGDTGYAKRTEKLIALARHARQRVQTHSRLELLAEPQSFAVCFRYRNRTPINPNDFNLQLRESLRRSGQALINYGYWNNNLALRFVAANPETETDDVDRLFDYLLAHATRMEEETQDGTNNCRNRTPS